MVLFINNSFHPFIDKETEAYRVKPRVGKERWESGLEAGEFNFNPYHPDVW